MSRLCRLVGVTRAGYYAWRHRDESVRQSQDRVLLEEMRAIFEASGGTYGSPRVHRTLTQRGHAVSRRRVERLMRTAGLRGRVVRVYRANPRLHRFFAQHANHVWRRQATRPNQIWVGDITYVAISGRWWHLAVVLDQYSRRVLLGAWAPLVTRGSREQSWMPPSGGGAPPWA